MATAYTDLVVEETPDGTLEAFQQRMRHDYSVEVAVVRQTSNGWPEVSLTGERTNIERVLRDVFNDDDDAIRDNPIGE